WPNRRPRPRRRPSPRRRRPGGLTGNGARTASVASWAASDPAPAQPVAARAAAPRIQGTATRRAAPMTRSGSTARSRLPRRGRYSYRVQGDTRGCGIRLKARALGVRASDARGLDDVAGAADGVDELGLDRIDLLAQVTDVELHDVRLA